MSPTIWTRCGGRRSSRPIGTRAWRMVEAQHRVSTLKLVDSVEEQALLEEMIETVKPPGIAPEEARGLHYLLSTPFRYPPLVHGSRFGRRQERGLWYGAETPRTVMAEVAYYRLRLLEGTAAELGHVATEHSLFFVPVRTGAGIDLTAAPFTAFSATLASKTGYAASQVLGTEMRRNGIEAFRFFSARDPEGGCNVGVFTPRAFASRQPGPAVLPVWHCTASRTQVVFRRRDLRREETVAFPREVFLVRGRLPVPGS